MANFRRKEMIDLLSMALFKDLNSIILQDFLKVLEEEKSQDNTALIYVIQKALEKEKTMERIADKLFKIQEEKLKKEYNLDLKTERNKITAALNVKRSGKETE